MLQSSGAFLAACIEGIGADLLIESASRPSQNKLASYLNDSPYPSPLMTILLTNRTLQTREVLHQLLFFLDFVCVPAPGLKDAVLSGRAKSHVSGL